MSYPCDAELTATRGDGTTGTYPCTLPYGHLGVHEMVRRSPDLERLVNDRDQLLAAARQLLAAYDADPPQIGDWFTEFDRVIEQLRAQVTQ